jgi:hypothetical protein
MFDHRLFLCLLPLVLAACAPPPSGRFAAFGDAAAGVHDTTRAAFATLRRDVLEQAVLTAPDAPIAADTFNPAARGYDISSSLQQVLVTLDVLAQYARSLQALAGADTRAGVDRSLRDFSISLQSLPNSGLSPIAIQQLSTLGDALGHAALEHRRRTALRDVMHDAQPVLEQIAAAMRPTTDNLHRFIGIMRDTYLRHANLDRPHYGTWARFQFDRSVAAKLEEFDTLDASLDATARAVKEFAATNRQLADTLDAPAAPSESLSIFIAEAKRLRSYYQALPSR